MELVQFGGWTGVFVGDIATNGVISGTWNDESGDFEFTAGKAIHTTWFSAEGTEIGPVIWGSFAIIQQVENDPCAGIHGLQWISPDRAGLGGW